MNTVFTVCLVLVFANAAYCGWDYPDGDYPDWGGDDELLDYYGNDGCYEKCDNTKSCKSLDKVKPRKRVKRCLDFLEDKCYNAGSPNQCLNELARKRIIKCPSYILKDALECLKCEIDCEKQETEPKGGITSSSGDNDFTDEENKCLDKCNTTNDCIALYTVNEYKLNICKKFASDTCGDAMQVIDCLDLTQFMENSDCPSSFRKQSLACMTCEDNCVNDYDGKFDKIDKTEKQCFDECAKTPSCMIFDGASEQRMQSCTALTRTRCESDDRDKIVECLESIADVSSIGCPKIFRKSAITCLKCDEKCSATASSSAETHMHKFSGGNKCEDKCDASPECQALEKYPLETNIFCHSYALMKCGTSDNMNQCITNLYGISDDCPAEYRKNMLKCMDCDDKCELMHTGENKEDMEECLDECSETSSCMAVDKAGGKLMVGCKAFTDKYCGSTENTIGCLESNNRNDPLCPTSFRKELINCMKCDKKCEEPQTMPKQGTCAYARMQAMKGEMMPGKFIPQCDEDGNYQTRQCSSSSGYCWCVDKMNGEELEGTQIPPGRPPMNCGAPPMPKKGTCAYEKMAAMRGEMMPGKFIPQCDEDGNYQTRQCSSSSGYCWCVDKMNGKELEGTQIPPGRPPMNCDAPPMPKKGTCAYEKMVAMRGEMMPGKFIPLCDEDGNYQTRQCSSSSGYCWCVDKMNGEELEGTQIPPGRPPMNCDAPPMPKKGTCAYKKMVAMRGEMMPGKFIPHCDEDGNYKTRQCSSSSGYCWCVDKMKGEELEGTQIPPGRPPINCDAPPSVNTPPPSSPPPRTEPASPTPSCGDSCTKYCAKKRNVIKPECMTCIKNSCDGSKETACVKKSIEGTCRPRCFLDEEAARRKACTDCMNKCAEAEP